MRIVTAYKANDKGTGQIVAKGQNRQRTVNYDHSLSREANFGSAAGTLALVLIEGETARKVAAKTAKVTHNSPTRVVFTLGE